MPLPFTINRDKFEAIQSVSWDKSLFSHLGSTLLTFGLTLGAEKAFEYQFADPKPPIHLLFLSFGSALFGVLFLGIATHKWFKLRGLNKGLFADENLLSDETIIHRSDGTKSIVSLARRNDQSRLMAADEKPTNWGFDAADGQRLQPITSPTQQWLIAMRVSVLIGVAALFSGGFVGLFVDIPLPRYIAMVGAVLWAIGGCGAIALQRTTKKPGILGE